MEENLLILDPICSKEWDRIDADLKKEFQELCVKNDWTALFQCKGNEYDLSFMSPYPEVEWTFKERSVLRCVQIALGYIC